MISPVAGNGFKTTVAVLLIAEPQPVPFDFIST
jgi:hypothetical protein